MRKFLKDIIDGNMDEVIRQIEKNPNLVNARAKQPPKKYNDQSALMIAIYHKHFDIANYLIDHGADIHFVSEADSTEDGAWHMPVINLAFMMAVRCCRHTFIYEIGNFSEVKHYDDKEMADASYELVRRLLDMGADINSCSLAFPDGVPGSTLDRVLSEAESLLPEYNGSSNKEGTPIPVDAECEHDLSRIFLLFKEYKAELPAEDDQWSMYRTWLSRPDSQMYPFVKLVAGDCDRSPEECSLILADDGNSQPGMLVISPSSKRKSINFCPECGQKVIENAKYCSACGAKLGEYEP